MSANMRICIPVAKDENQNDIINKDFENTTSYMIVDTQTSQSTVLNEHDLKTIYDADNPLEALLKAGIDSIITPIIRSAAFVILKKRTEIQVFTSITDNIKENIELLMAGKLLELTDDGLMFTMSCAGECSSCASTTCK